MKGDHRWFAAFLCLLGFLLYVAAIAGANWPAPEAAKGSQRPSFYLLLSVLLAGVGLAAGFYGLHSRKLALFRPFSRGGRSPIASKARYQRRSNLLRMYFGGIGLILVAASAFYFSRASSLAGAPAPDPSHFAIVVPLPAATEPTGAESSSAPPGLRSSSLAETGSSDRREPPGQPAKPDNAVLFWNVEPSSLPLNPGLFPMVIAAGLVAAFGLIYPQVVGSGDEQGKGFLEKLVAPALGLILFGVGVSEQANAEEQREDIRLVSQGLQPVLSLPSGRRAFVLRAGDTSSASTQQLQTSINNLIYEIRNDKTPAPVIAGLDDEKLIERLSEIRSEIRDSTALTDRTARRESAILRQQLERTFLQSGARLAEIYREIGEARQGLSDLRKEDQALFCALVRSQSTRAAVDSALANALLDKQDARDRENILRRSWNEMIGRKRLRLETERSRIVADGGQARLDAAFRECATLAGNGDL